MPTYLKDINHTVTPEEAEAIIGRAKNLQQQALIAILFITGARPDEIVRMEAGHIRRHQAFDNRLIIKMWTSKLKPKPGFTVSFRDLVINENEKNSKFIKIIESYAANRPEKYLLFPFTTTWVRRLVYKMSENTLCPYHFRHSRLYRLAQAGATGEQLREWKGANDIRSVTPYVRGKPVGIYLVVE